MKVLFFPKFTKKNQLHVKKKTQPVSVRDVYIICLTIKTNRNSFQLKANIASHKMAKPTKFKYSISKASSKNNSWNFFVQFLSKYNDDAYYVFKCSRSEINADGRVSYNVSYILMILFSSLRQLFMHTQHSMRIIKCKSNQFICVYFTIQSNGASFEAVIIIHFICSHTQILFFQQYDIAYRSIQKFVWNLNL